MFPHTSKFATLSAFSWMNSRLGGATSPISLTKISSASATALRYLASVAALARKHRRKVAPSIDEANNIDAHIGDAIEDYSRIDDNGAKAWR